MKPDVFAFARPPKPAASPLAELAEKMRNFTPPPKPAEVLEAEASLAEAKAARTELQAELEKLVRLGIRARDGEPGISQPRQSEFLVAEERLKAANAVVAARSEAVAEVSLPWRRQYAAMVAEESIPIRRELHKLAGELEAGLTALRDLAGTASLSNVGSPWIDRSAPMILPLGLRLKALLEFDASLLAQEDL